MAARLTLIALEGIPLIEPGDNLLEIILRALDLNNERLTNGDILVIAQKIVSKAEGRIVNLEDVEPSVKATELARKAGKDPRQVELILRESREVVRSRPGVIIVEQNLGVVMANAGIDHSNIDSTDGMERVLLLPVDPDKSCRALRQGISERLDVSVAVIINDSVGRAWRVGTVGLAIGVAGLPAIVDLRGENDIFGRELMVSEQAVADELASAASLLQGQAAERLPVVLVRGFESDAPDQNSEVLIRNRDMDMFR
ncbi:MAG: coenzyme F420-0:L-glutamate ligase [Rhodospirillaceae bacterium]|nr:coenzyme F420-0:L-glutamate ligase [Rhodospirillaceae bacterium]|tara:strand:- start:1553 stop:2320 length:768 start_codon:yes stop_codon:yes gene_type:complete